MTPDRSAGLPEPGTAWPPGRAFSCLPAGFWASQARGLHMNFTEKAVIMNAKEMNRALKRMAHEIIEANKGIDNLVLLGVQRRG